MSPWPMYLWFITPHGHDLLLYYTSLFYRKYNDQLFCRHSGRCHSSFWKVVGYRLKNQPGSCFSSSWIIWLKSPELFCRCENPPPNGRWPQASQSLRTNKVNPCDTALFPHLQLIREFCMIWSLLCNTCPITKLLKMLCWKFRTF